MQDFFLTFLWHFELRNVLNFSRFLRLISKLQNFLVKMYPFFFLSTQWQETDCIKFEGKIKHRNWFNVIHIFLCTVQRSQSNNSGYKELPCLFSIKAPVIQAETGSKTLILAVNSIQSSSTFKLRDKMFNGSQEHHLESNRPDQIPKMMEFVLTLPHPEVRKSATAFKLAN